jgi:hypothetical protein
MKAYVLEMQLRDMKPKIWRKVVVPEKITVAELAYIVLTIFEMKASHLFKVTAPVGKTLFESYKAKMGDAFNLKAFRKEHPDIETIRYRYELLSIIDDFGMNPNSNDLIFDVAKAKLSHAISNIGETLELWYDFGDDWFIDIKLVEIIESEKSVQIPEVIEGEGFGILEDAGGVWGLQEIAKACLNKKSKKCLEYASWYGIKDLDIALFDKTEMNDRLRVIPQIFKRSYEKKQSPSQSEIDYLDRKRI